MATKAQRFRSQVERSGPKRPPAPPRPRRDQIVDTAQPGVSATDRKAGGESTAARNRSKSAARKAGYVLEDSNNDTPSRKSTRKGANRIKPDANLQRRQTRQSRSPGSRARVAQATGKGPRPRAR